MNTEAIKLTRQQFLLKNIGSPFSSKIIPQEDIFIESIQSEGAWARILGTIIGTSRVGGKPTRNNHSKPWEGGFLSVSLQPNPPAECDRRNYIIKVNKDDDGVTDVTITTFGGEEQIVLANYFEFVALTIRKHYAKTLHNLEGEPNEGNE
jgi:hypothetical protein